LFKRIFLGKLILTKIIKNENLKVFFTIA